MFVRVRGKGGSPENSQATLMYLRAFRHAPTPLSPGSYTTLANANSEGKTSGSSSSSAAAAHPSLALHCRPFAYPTFFTGIHSTRCDTGSTEHILVAEDSLSICWKEIWNILDIIYDEVPMARDFKSAADLTAAIRAGMGASVPLHSLYPSMPKLTGAKKVLVCPHYFHAEARTLEQLCPLNLQQQQPLSLSGDSLSSLFVFDVAHIADLRKIAVEVAWLGAFYTMQPGASHHPGQRAVALVRLPVDVFPSVSELEYTDSTATKGDDDSFVSLARVLLDMSDFVGQHLSMLWEGGAGSDPLIVRCVGKEEDLTDVVAAAGVTRVQQVVWLRSDEAVAAASSEAGNDKSAEGQLKRLTAALKSSAPESWVVPLKALKEGEEEEWDAYTQRERARLNFCPCCGDGHEAHEHGHGHHHH